MKVFENEDSQYQKIFELDTLIRDEVVRTSLESFPRKLSEIHYAIINDESKEVQRHAHALKGAVGYFGVRKINDLTYKLEMMGKENQLENSISVFNELKKALDQLIKYFSSPGWKDHKD